MSIYIIYSIQYNYIGNNFTQFRYEPFLYTPTPFAWKGSHIITSSALHSVLADSFPNLAISNGERPMGRGGLRMKDVTLNCGYSVIWVNSANFVPLFIHGTNS